MRKLTFILLLLLAVQAGAQELSLRDRVREIAAAREQQARRDPSPAELLRAYRYDEYREQYAALSANETPARHQFDWLFLTENLPVVDSITAAGLDFNPHNPDLLLQRGKLRYALIKRDSAEIDFIGALTFGTDPALVREAKLGLADIYEKNREYQQAFDTLLTLFDTQHLDDKVLFKMGTTLIYLGRTGESIDMFEEAVAWNPFNRLAHYYLGNGYARRNYTQLWEAHDNFDCGEDEPRLLDAESQIASGEIAAAAETLRKFIREMQNCPRAYVMYGSVLWNLRNYAGAIEQFQIALELLPDYGRAHNGLARSLESYRMLYNINREHDEQVFAETPMPDVSLIEQYVLNWNSLSPRLQKQVALSVAPWKNYLPVLVESGSHHYVKPLYQMLSECPGLETIADQRISYDSRLWDDVRGCGGYTTVTGIEDVERSIFYAYNTVLHELTHQVHWTFPPEDVKRIEDAFHAADTREENGTPTYMSRYQASSVYEYLAEGANAMFSPRRNKWDTREIVRERLYELDPALVKLLEYYLPAPDLEACYPVGLVNAVNDAIENHDLELAQVYAARAQARDHAAEVVLGMLARLNSLLDQDTLAIAYAESLVTAYPSKATSHSALQSAEFFTNGKAARSIEILEAGRAVVDANELNDLRVDLGEAYWYDGDYSAAAEEFLAVLKTEPNNDAALRGLAKSFGDAGLFEAADSVFEKAVQRRSGVAELRLDYTRMLLAAGRLDDAATQLDEAKLLAPGIGSVLTYEGWLLLSQHEPDAARSKLDEALKIDPGFRLALVLQAKVEAESGASDRAAALAEQIQADRAADIPEWHYLEHLSAYVARKTWPDFVGRLAESL